MSGKGRRMADGQETGKARQILASTGDLIAVGAVFGIARGRKDGKAKRG
jgi:hypothetical protein